ncbi:MAG TPA: hypothetical protein EYQ51_05295 [Alphaproteobacteria bacterium]|jgi:hypothetical protein|nr:hypothetical protein [Alphaproteobacteria bacterium]
MRGLKFLVIFMGILIILGTSFLVFTIVKKGSDIVISKNSNIDASSIEINSPNNMTLKNVNSNNQNVILKFEDDKKYILQIISLKSGELLKQIHINK